MEYTTFGRTGRKVSRLGFGGATAGLKEEGLIRHVGVTGEAESPPLYRFIRTGRFDTIQMCYNLFFPHPCDPAGNPAVSRRLSRLAPEQRGEVALVGESAAVRNLAVGGASDRSSLGLRLARGVSSECEGTVLGHEARNE